MLIKSGNHLQMTIQDKPSGRAEVKLSINLEKDYLVQTEEAASSFLIFFNYYSNLNLLLQNSLTFP